MPTTKLVLDLCTNSECPDCVSSGVECENGGERTFRVFFPSSPSPADLTMGVSESSYMSVRRR